LDQPNLSGLANPADANFGLSTNVPPLTETANAFTGTHQIFDVAGNSVTAGPIGGNMIDKKPPAIAITSPMATTYIVHQPVQAKYGCTDGGSGVRNCIGILPNGWLVDTLFAGNKTFGVLATDNVGNVGTGSVSYTVSYNVCLTYDPNKAMSGRPVRITLQLCDFKNLNVSSLFVPLTALAVDGNPSLAKSLGFPNPGNLFAYGPPFALGGSYAYLLDTNGLASGKHVLTFKAFGDPIIHSAAFTLK